MYIERECREKRGGGRVSNASAVAGSEGNSSSDNFDWVPSAEPTAEFLAEVEEECERLLESLDDVRLRKLARLKLIGFTNREISSRMEISLRSVERKLRVIRTV